MKIKNRKHIYWLHVKGQTGWFLSIIKKKEGIIYREWFSAKKYGRVRGLLYAEQTRDLILALAGE